MEEQKEGKDLKKEIEAILFAAGRKVSLDEIMQLCKEKDKGKVERALQDLKEYYSESDSPMFLVQEGDGWKMTVKEKYLGLVKDVAPHTELNRALLETLAIIAWKQPVLQSDVIKIRGSTAYEHIRDLVEMGFITKVKHGRSYVLKPSSRFFDYFDLPSKESVKEIFKDVEVYDTEKRKELGEKSEEQKKIEGMETDNLGKLRVYEEQKEKSGEVEKAENEMETEKIGKLEVYSEKEDSGEKEEETEKAAETEEPEENEIEEKEETHETAEEKTEHIVEKLMHEKGKQEGEVPESFTESQEDIAEEQAEESEKKRRLSKELEEFAGLGSEEKENKGLSEEREENSEDQESEESEKKESSEE